MEFRTEFVENNIRKALTETNHRDLHFICGSQTVSYHQGILSSHSSVLRDLLSERACCKCSSASCGNVQDVTVYLDGVDMDTMCRLMEYIYTGQCMVRDRRDVLDMIQLKNMLMLDISIELARKTIKREPNGEAGTKQHAVIKHPELPFKQPKPPNNKTSNKSENPLKSVDPKPDQSTHPELAIIPEHCRKETPLATRHTSKTSSSILERVVESIQPQNKYECIQSELFSNSYDSIREEIYKTVQEPDADLDDYIPSMPCTEMMMERDADLDDGIPSMPTEMMIEPDTDLDDTIPSMPTEMLIEELDNEEKRLTQDIMSFIDNMGDMFQEMPCTECGQRLSKDTFIMHYKTHVESIQEAKDKLVTGHEVPKNVFIESTPNIKTKSPAMENYTNSIFPTPPQIDEPVKVELSDEDKMNKLQEEQTRISKDIVAFMSLFQKGVQQLQCSECLEVLTQISIVEHFKKHIMDLNSEIELLVYEKRELKRKQDLKQKDNSRKKSKHSQQTPMKKGISSGILPENSTPKIKIAPQDSDSFSKFLDSVCPRMGIENSSSKTTPKSREEERKKIYKRLYGRKKYQYRINNCTEDVKVSEEEIDDEIAKSHAKYTGQPTAALDALILNTANSETVTASQVLQTFVQTGSKEYKHEFKKARDRLYKRKLRIVRMNGGSGDMDIPKTDIEIEMLSRYTSNKIKVEAMDAKKETEVPCTNPWWEMTSAGLEPEIDINIGALEANLDLGFGGADQWITSNDPMMGEIIEMEYPNISGIDFGMDPPPDMLTDHYYGVNTTLEEGVDDMMAF